MKVSNVMAFAVGAGLCVGLYACGSSDNSVATTPVQPNQPTATIYSVNDVYVKAQKTSETDDPFTVNGNSLAQSNDETSDPMSID
jgi:hypothetical protein